MDGCEKVNNDIYMLLHEIDVSSMSIYTHLYRAYIETRNAHRTIRFYSLNNLFGRMIDIHNKKRKYFL